MAEEPQDDDQAATLEEAARDELHALWDDLLRARDNALRGRWSMECDALVYRIKRLTPFVGPTPWENIQIRLLEDGTYQRVHREMGVEAPVDMEGVAETRAYIDRPVEELRARSGGKEHG